MTSLVRATSLNAWLRAATGTSRSRAIYIVIRVCVYIRIRAEKERKEKEKKRPEEKMRANFLRVVVVAAVYIYARAVYIYICASVFSVGQIRYREELRNASLTRGGGERGEMQNFLLGNHFSFSLYRKICGPSRAFDYVEGEQVMYSFDKIYIIYYSLTRATFVLCF